MKKTNKERRKSKLKIPGGENKREDSKSSKSDFIKHKKFKEKLQKFAHSRTTLIGLLILLIIVLLFTDFVALRMKLARQVDDVNLFIYCDNGIIEKSDMLMVIPLYKNVSIAENKGWCEWIVGLNKTLGMH